MTIKTREPDERFKAQVPDFKLEKRARPKYRTWRDDPDQEPKVEANAALQVEPVFKTEEAAPIAAQVEALNGQITISELPENALLSVRELSHNGKITDRIPSDNGQIEAPVSEERSDKASDNGKRTVSDRSDNGKRTVRQDMSKGLSFSSLVGLQKLLVNYYYESIQANGGEATHEIRSKDLQTLFGSDSRTVIDANYQLTKKGVIYRAEYKDGRAGWTKFGIEKSIKEQIHRLIMVRERSDNGKSTVRELYAERSDQRSDGGSSSSILFTTPSEIEGDSLPSKTATTGTSPRPSDPDYSWVDKIEIGPDLSQSITPSHLRQLARYGFTATESDLVQSSLDNLAYALGLGRQYKSVSGVFMAVMKRDGYFSPVESPEFNRDRARRAMETDKAQVEEAIQQEVARLAYKKLDETKPKTESLDITPF